jgi:hypothetical protein
MPSKQRTTTNTEVTGKIVTRESEEGAVVCEPLHLRLLRICLIRQMEEI